MSAKFFVRATFPLLSCAAVLLSGCNLQSTGNLVGPQVQGGVHGGQQPIAGAHVYLFAAGTGGYGGKGITSATGNSSTSLLTNSVLTNNSGQSGKDSNNNYYVTTDSSGSFSITGDYTCTAGQQLYIYAVGGNPGAGPNSAAGLMAAIGDCTNATPATYLFVNEVSTVAAAYALAAFASDATHISSSGTTLAKTGIANAFKNAANLAVLGTGAAVDKYGTNAAPRVNYLANVIAACINSTGSMSDGCIGLLPVATSDGTTSGIRATDTATAAIYIAHNPASNVTALYNLPPADSPFPATLTPQPSDWTIALQFTGGAYAAPAVLAVDGQGNVWTANSNAHNLSEFSSTGTALSNATYGDNADALKTLSSLAIDSAGNVWTANNNTPGELFEFSPAGYYEGSSTGYFANNTTGLAFNSANTLWMVGSTGLAEVTMGLGNVTANPAPSILSHLALDSSNVVWAVDTNMGGSKLYKYSAVGASGVSYTGGGLYAPSSIAIDASGNVWTTSAGTNSFSKFIPTSASFVNSGYSGVSQPKQIAFDGAGSAWIINASTLYQVDSASGSVLHGYTGGGLSAANSVALDGSGNVWLTTNTGVVEFLGLGAPTVTPLAGNLIAPYTHAASTP